MNLKIQPHLFMLVIIIFSIGCNKEDNPVSLGIVPSITKLELQDKWNIRATLIYKIEVWAKDPQGISNLSGVQMIVSESSSGNQIFTDSLYDDGAYYYINDGDVLAGDGVYSNKYRPADINQALKEAEYMFQFIAIDKQHNESQVLEYPVFFGPNNRPQVQEISAPDIIPSGSQDIIFSISASDSDGTDDIIIAFFESENIEKGYKKFEQYLYNDGDLTNHGDVTAGDSVFSTKINSDFLSGKQGRYNLLFYVEDSFGERNAETAAHEVVIGNQPGEFLQINVPETMNIPTTEGEYNRELMTAEVLDPDGLADIDSVYFYSLKPDSTYANDGLPILLVDNGLPFNISNAGLEAGDLVAGDGTYSFSILTYHDTVTGLYTFSFFIRDKAGNLTGPVSKTINILGN